jgi:hypothetical protein
MMTGKQREELTLFRSDNDGWASWTDPFLVSPRDIFGERGWYVMSRPMFVLIAASKSKEELELLAKECRFADWNVLRSRKPSVSARTPRRGCMMSFIRVLSSWSLSGARVQFQCFSGFCGSVMAAPGDSLMRWSKKELWGHGPRRASLERSELGTRKRMQPDHLKGRTMPWNRLISSVDRKSISS